MTALLLLVQAQPRDVAGESPAKVFMSHEPTWGGGGDAVWMFLTWDAVQGMRVSPEVLTQP